MSTYQDNDYASKQVKFAAISASTSGDNNTLVAAVTGKKIRVLSVTLISNGSVNAKFSSDPTGTPTYISGLAYLVANVGFASTFDYGLFETASGKALGLNLSGAVAVGGFLTYIELP